MKFKLVIVAGEGLRNEVELTPPVVIGRSRAADVTVGHPLVSRRHCEITEGDDNLLVVEDLGSLNGTYVGDVRIEEPVYLEPGDLLTVGSVTFQALYGDFQQAADGAAQATEEMPDFAMVGEGEEAGEVAVSSDDLTEPVPLAKAGGFDFDAPDVEEVEEVVDEVEEVEEIVDEVEEIVDEVEEVEEVQESEQTTLQATEIAAPTPAADDEMAMQWLNGEAEEDGDGEEAEEEAAEASAGDDDLDDFFKKL